MLIPKRTKFRKQFRGRMKGRAQKGNTVTYGEYGLVALEPAWITNRQIEAARIAMTRHVQRQAKIWICVFPDKPLTKKPLETRMGKGKGGVEEWVMNIKPGRIIFEMAGPSEKLSRSALTLSMHKLPFKSKIVTRESENELY